MKSFRWRWFALLVVVGSVIAGASASAYHIKADTAAPSGSPQDTFNLERRISSLEQRLYSIELSINRLEQQSQTNARNTPPANRRDVELDLLQTQIRTLQGQLDEIGCGLRKVDERTLSASVRQSRRRDSDAATDPCRLNPDTPVRLSMQR